MVAGTDSSVLISGETGTGKELIARAIHDLSKRKDRPLIKVNCAALPAGLIESELFGHEKGAFTGAISRKIGRFELADGGTLFLDEIGDLPPGVQAKLLRVLQEHEFERVGGTQTIKVDVRLITATNRDLAKAVEENSFRTDLYYRLNVFPIHLPPLRERKEDIPLLTQYFINKYMTRMGKRIEKISQETMNRLIAYPWPGNIRELENIIERAVILSKGLILEIEDELLPSSHLPDQKEKGSLTLEEVERDHIVKILEKARWVIEGPKGAAKILNLHPNTLRSRMQKLGIKRPLHDIS
jgi:transcriptional regulator with GAF, ATPase, and Fis domain